MKIRITDGPRLAHRWYGIAVSRTSRPVAAGCSPRVAQPTPGPRGVVPGDTPGLDHHGRLAEQIRPQLLRCRSRRCRSRSRHAAATKLLRAIEGHPLEQGVQLMPCRLVTRQSTAITP